ncbi:MAG: ankyrin repeat domain-containing protein [Hyphomonas sp.]|nr:ankyrin repeat domain-containing protein [Hyphomonas sp.]
MRVIQSTLIAGLLALAACAHGAAEPEPPPRETGWNVAPFHPHIIRNDAPELCEPVAAAWTELFNAAGRLDSADLDLSGVPHEAAFAFPATVASGRAARSQSLYYKTFEARHDIDGDGDEEVLFLVSNDAGWRYLGGSLYLFDTVAEFDAMRAQYPERYGEISSTYHWNELAAEVTGEPVATFGRVHRVQLFLQEGALYTVSDGRGVSRGQDSKRETLRRVWPAEEAETVCEIQIRPEPEQFDPFISASPFYQALKAMYAGPSQGGMCYGTLGWTGVPPGAILPDLFYRPQAWPEPNGRFGPEDEPQDDVARQLRPLSWGATDPFSWQVYLSLRQDQPDFLRRMEEYYAERFAMPADEAKAEALQAWRALVDRIFYARNNDMLLAFLATQPMNRDNPVDFPFGASPNEMLDAVETALKQPEALNNITPWWHGAIWARQISAAILAGDPVEDIRDLYRAYVGTYLPPADPSKPKRYERDIARLHANVLAAASVRPDVLGILPELGVPLGRSTNRFGKTALMYAAQLDMPDSVRVLLDAGVDVNQRTQSVPEGERYRTCGKLQRDHRTALMYAAENASEELILMLLDAGADPAAEDTEGNTTSWYLARNAKLDDDARARLETRLAVE